MSDVTPSQAQGSIQQGQVVNSPYIYLQPSQRIFYDQNCVMTNTVMQTPNTAQDVAQPVTINQDSLSVPSSQINTQGIAVNTAPLMTASGQVMSTGPKGNFQQQMMTTTPGKSQIFQTQSNFIPASANQTVVIGQLVPNQQNIFNHKILAESNKVKTYTFQNQHAALHPKNIYSSTLPVHSTAQAFNGGQFKQITSAQPQITSQAQGNALSTSQIIGFQTLGSSLPPGFSWATPGCLQQYLMNQNPIIIRSSQESNMFMQSQPPAAAMHVPVAAATPALPLTSFVTSTPVVPKLKQIKARTGMQTNAIATQTVSDSASFTPNIPVFCAQQIKPKVSTPTISQSTPQFHPQIAQIQTQTNQSSPQILPQLVLPASTPIMPVQNSNASYQTQTSQVIEQKIADNSSKFVSADIEAKPLQIIPKSQVVMAPSSKIEFVPQCSVNVSFSTSTVTTSSSMPMLPTSTVQVNIPVPTVNMASTLMRTISPVESIPQIRPPEPGIVTNGKPLETSPESEIITQEECAEILPEPATMTHEDLLETPQEPAIVTHEELLETPPEPDNEPIKPTTTELIETSIENEHLKPQQSLMKPSLAPVKEKQPQKAIVKPHILTHVIDSFLIHEGPEPFPVKTSLHDSQFQKSAPEKIDIGLKRKNPPTIPCPKTKKLKVQQGRVLGRKSKRRRRKGRKPQIAIEEPIVFTIEDDNMSDAENESSAFTNENEGSAMSEQSSVVEIEEIPQPPRRRNTQKLLSNWSVQDVCEFIKDVTGSTECADMFESQEIDGQALLLLTEDHFRNSMSMKLGPAVKLMSHINALKSTILNL